VSKPSRRNVSAAEAVGAQNRQGRFSLRSVLASSLSIVLLPEPASPRKPVNWSELVRMCASALFWSSQGGMTVQNG